MTHAVRINLAVTLSVLLVLTGQGLAASRGMSAATGQMVICTGTGPVVVYVDENGQPTKAPHFCPDHALTLLGAIAQPEQALAEAGRRPLLRAFTRWQDPVQWVFSGGNARAPPFVV